jgi:hypothetical protein
MGTPMEAPLDNLPVAEGSRICGSALLDTKTKENTRIKLKQNFIVIEFWCLLSPQTKYSPH